MKDKINNLKITWQKGDPINGVPVRHFKGYGHEASITFGYDDMWAVVIDHRGQTFPDDQEAKAIEYAECVIRGRLLARLEAAEKLFDDIKSLVDPSAQIERDQHGHIMLSTVPEGYCVVPSALGRKHDLVVKSDDLKNHNGSAPFRFD